MFENEVIEYTGGNRTDTSFLMWLYKRYKSAPYRGVSPEKTTASSHPNRS